MTEQLRRNLPSLQQGEAAMSDVPEGYKMSEVGVIPVEWEVKSLENIGLFRKGKNIPKKDLTSEGVPCVLYGEIYTKYNFTSKKLNSFIPHAIAQQSTSINKGDILFAGSGETAEEIGKCFTYLGDEKACAGGDINILSPFNDDSTFLGYLLNSPQVNKQKSNLGQGSSVVHIYSSSLKTILIPSPPLPEQQVIASALSDVDALITALEQLITKKRNIKQGAMQQLITGKKRLPGFGGEWEVKRLGEYVTIASGESPSKFKFKNNGTPYYKVDQLNYGNKYQKDTPYFIECNNPISKGSIIFPKRGAAILLNKVRILTEDAFMDTNLMTLTTIEELDNEYLYYVLIYIGLWHVADTTSIPQINNKHIKPIEIPFPSPSEQTAIAKILSDMDTEIEALEQKRDKYKAIKQGMMQELLTGKRRLA